MNDPNSPSLPTESALASASEPAQPELATTEPDLASAPSSFDVQPTDIPLFTIEPAPAAAIQIPTLGNTFLFFGIAIAVTTGVGIVTIGLGRLLPPFRHQDLRSLAFDARLAIPSQAIQYLALLAITAVIFANIWKRPFWQSVQWNPGAVAKRWFLLIAAGAILGLASGAASNYLPMPKEAPILNDLMRSTAGAWMMFLFGTTLAPLTEELAFRGFLLPSLINFFKRFIGRSKPATTSLSLYAASPDTRSTDPPFPGSLESPPRPPSLFVVIDSIVLTSMPFAWLHAQQVSGAWAPILLIGLVSIVLCIVRLWTRSLAASTLVHATYNFTLFAGMLIASDGFRHLDKLK